MASWHVTTEPKAEEERILFPEITFDFDLSAIEDSMLPLLEEVVAILNKKSGDIVLEGYTCDLGTDAYNQKLSERRATSVKMFLVGKGIDASRIEIVGYSENRPKYDNSTKEGRALNRRVEIRFE